MKTIAIFASGNGTNAENICSFFENHSKITVSVLFTNNGNALVVERMKSVKIPVYVFSNKDFSNGSLIENSLSYLSIDFIILAGFLLKIPSKLIACFPNRIINIHPSLLPKYGGRGMYGSNIHKSVIKNKERFSGITIHYVNTNYDEGEVIFQKKCDISFDENIDSLSKKIAFLEKEHFPKLIEKTLLK